MSKRAHTEGTATMGECSIPEIKEHISINFVQEVPRQGLNHEFKSRLYQAHVKKKPC
jgi:hypothetical protein